MSWEEKLLGLRIWADRNGGYIHPNVVMQHSREAGVHFRAIEEVILESNVCSVPNSLALSTLNALVDDTFSVFRDRGLAVEAIGYFYLMHQYILDERSFWRPYLRTLPQPQSELLTPFWFDDTDLRWLANTDVLHTATARKEMHKQYYRQGLLMLERDGIDAAPYTWDLFRWAVTIYTSRAFSSLALRPQESKYWTAHKHGPSGGRQTILLDMSRTAAEDLDFPVLLPLLDIPNHHHDAKVDLVFDSGRSGIRTRCVIHAGHEVLNNYGPKGNDELLLGYGFCTPDNPNDKVLLTIKPPSDALQQDLRHVHAGYFALSGGWSSEKATFGLIRMVPNQDAPSSIFQQLPEPLLELLLYMLFDERNLPFQFIDRPAQFLAAESSDGRHCLPFVTRMIVQSLVPKLAILQASTPASTPQNAKQLQASIYRQGQVEILQSVVECLRSYLRSLLYASVPRRASAPGLFDLESLVDILQRRSGRANSDAFLQGIAVNAGSSDFSQLREAGWEEDTLALLLCFKRLSETIDSVASGSASQMKVGMSNDDVERANSLLELVRSAAKYLPSTPWGDSRWNESFIMDHGGGALKNESFMMMVPSNDGKEVPRLVVYLPHA